MIEYPLTEKQKRLIFSLLPWLSDRSLSTEWTVEVNRDGSVEHIDGLDKQGLLWRSGWNDVQSSDFQKYVEVGLMRYTGTSPAREYRYTLDEYAISEAIRTNFMRSSDAGSPPSEVVYINANYSVVNYKTFLNNVTQRINTAPALDQTLKNDLLNEMQKLAQVLEIASSKYGQDVAAVNKQLERLAEDLSSDPPDVKTATITAESLKNAARSLIVILPAASIIIDKIGELVQRIGS